MNKYHVFFSRLASPLRIDILSTLREGPMSVTQLCESLKTEQSRLSHALALLKKCSLVQVRKKGRRRIYTLNKETISPMLEILDKHRREYCGCIGNCEACEGGEK